MKTYHTCFALDQIFVGLDGQPRACCMAQKALGGDPTDPSELFATKRAINAMIADSNDASLCWKSCPARNIAEHRPETERIGKIVVYTNTFCPLGCEYCSLAHPLDAPEWSAALRPHNDRPNTWNNAGKSGRYQAPVRVHDNNTPGLLDTLRRLASDPRRPNTLMIEFTGGDSSYHPDFVAALDYLASEDIQVSYLSSGVVPPRVQPDILRHVAEGRLHITVSPDAIWPETWARIKRRPPRLFDEVLKFLSACANVQLGNQTGVKFIVLENNLVEAPVFIPFFASLGIRRFVLSEYRAQPVFFVSPASEEKISKVCADTMIVFGNSNLPPDSDLTVIGLERFFDGHSRFQLNTLGQVIAA